MNEVVNGLVPSALSRPYRYVKLEWNADFAMLTVRMGVRPIQCYSLAAMAELQQVFNDITAHPGLVRHFVMASDVHGVFNFGGDLSLFVLLVRAHDLDSLAPVCASVHRPRLVVGERSDASAFTRPHWSRATPWGVASNRPFFTTP